MVTNLNHDFYDSFKVVNGIFLVVSIKDTLSGIVVVVISVS